MGIFPNFCLNQPIFLQGYIRYIRDILQPWCYKGMDGMGWISGWGDPSDTEANIGIQIQILGFKFKYWDSNSNIGIQVEDLFSSKSISQQTVPVPAGPVS